MQNKMSGVSALSLIVSILKQCDTSKQRQKEKSVGRMIRTTMGTIKRSGMDRFAFGRMIGAVR